MESAKEDGKGREVERQLGKRIKRREEGSM